MIVYIAGQYRSKLGLWGVRENIHAAMAVAREYWKRGFAVICPHGNTAYMDGADIPDMAFINGDLEILVKCDVIVMLPYWEYSEGAKIEHQFAKDHGLKIQYLED